VRSRREASDEPKRSRSDRPALTQRGSGEHAPHEVEVGEREEWILAGTDGKADSKQNDGPNHHCQQGSLDSEGRSQDQEEGQFVLEGPSRDECGLSIARQQSQRREPRPVVFGATRPRKQHVQGCKPQPDRQVGNEYTRQPKLEVVAYRAGLPCHRLADVVNDEARRDEEEVNGNREIVHRPLGPIGRRHPVGARRYCRVKDHHRHRANNAARL